MLGTSAATSTVTTYESGHRCNHAYRRLLTVAVFVLARQRLDCLPFSLKTNACSAMRDYGLVWITTSAPQVKVLRGIQLVREAGCSTLHGQAVPPKR